MIVSLTGKPGSGKTTLLKEIVENFESKIGFITQEIRIGDERMGFEAISSWGEKTVLAKKGMRSRWRVGRYGVDLESFEKRIVIPMMENFENFDVIYVDEVGKMECLSKVFVKLVENLLNLKDKLVIFTIPFRDFNDTIARVRRMSDMVYELPRWRGRSDEILKEISRR